MPPPGGQPSDPMRTPGVDLSASSAGTDDRSRPVADLVMLPRFMSG